MKEEERSMEPEVHDNRAFDDACEEFADDLAAGTGRSDREAREERLAVSVAGGEREGEEEGEVASLESNSHDSLGNSSNYAPTSSASSPEEAMEQLEEERSKRSGKEFEISWRNLDYVVTSSWFELTSQRKPILNGLSGSFKSGQLSAVLGPSGAGKSTFIECLLGKRSRGLSGRTRVSFASPDEELERRRSRPLKIATIPQEDHLMDSLTVTETFMFASRIKNAQLSREEELSGDGAGRKSGRAFDHFANVQRVIKQLNLASCASLRCGSLSGGQYKRVSIGQELLSRPDLLILDEPTSGLDSVTCYQTVKALRELIDGSPYPMAIVCTIHQPDVEVFELFHKAYVLASGGRAIYEGPTGAIAERVQLALECVESRRKLQRWQKFHSSVGAENDLGPLKAKLSGQLGRLNPARLIVEVGAHEHGYELSNAMSEMQLEDWRMEAREEPLGSSRPGTSRGSHSSVSLAGSLPELEPKPAEFRYELAKPSSRKPQLDKLLCLLSANVNQRRSARVYLSHLWLHFRRSWTTILRDPMLFSLQVFLHIFVPLLISYSFQGQRGDACPKVGPLDVIEEAYRRDGSNILDELQRELRVVFENVGYMFFQIYVIIFAAVCVTSLTYPLIMHVLLKEYRNGWYSMSSYFVGRTLADLPVPTLNVFIAMGISYHLTGQPLSPYGWRFLCVAGLTCLATLVAQTQGLMFGALLMNAPQSAVFVAPASTAPLVVVSGFLIRIQNLPAPLKLLSSFSYFTHLLNGFIVARYGFHRCPCQPEDFAIEPTHEVPAQAKTLTNIWVESFGQEYAPANGSQPPPVDLVDNLVSTISRAKTFGHQISSCEQLKPFTMLDYQLADEDLYVSFAVLLLMLFAFRWLTYVTLSWKISSCV